MADKEKEFLARCSLIFKQFNHDVNQRLKNSTWDFETTFEGKKYGIVCLPKTNTTDFLQSGGQTLVISTVLSLFLISIFLSLDGHLYLLKLVLESYIFLPIGMSLNITEVSNAGIMAFGKMLYLTALIMLPVVGGMLLINIAGGIITRSAPTLNLFSFIFPVSLVSVFIFLYLALGPIANAFSDITGICINLIDNILRSGGIQ